MLRIEHSARDDVASACMSNSRREAEQDLKDLWRMNLRQDTGIFICGEGYSRRLMCHNMEVCYVLVHFATNEAK